MGHYHYLLYPHYSAGTSLDQGTCSCSETSYLAIIFAYCCKAHYLRGAGIQDESEGGAKLLEKGFISQEELDTISKQSGWEPYHCIDAMRVTISEGLRSNEKQDVWEMNAAQTAMEGTICILANSIGGCIRVRSTGLPVAYDDILNMTGLIFFTAACLVWAPGAGLYNPFVVLIVYTIVKMIVGVGSDMVRELLVLNVLLLLLLLSVCSHKILHITLRKTHLETMNLTCLLRSSVKRWRSKSLRLMKGPSSSSLILRMDLPATCLLQLRGEDHTLSFQVFVFSWKFCIYLSRKPCIFLSRKSFIKCKLV